MLIKNYRYIKRVKRDTGNTKPDHLVILDVSQTLRSCVSSY